MRQALKSYPAILIFFLVYTTLSLINLDSLPVAWTDEVLNLDPAVQFIHNGQYISSPFSVVDGQLCACNYVLTCDDEHVWPALVLHVQPACVAALNAFAPRGLSMRAEELRHA